MVIDSHRRGGSFPSIEKRGTVVDTEESKTRSTNEALKWRDDSRFFQNLRFQYTKKKHHSLRRKSSNIEPRLCLQTLRKYFSMKFWITNQTDECDEMFTYCRRVLECWIKVGSSSQGIEFSWLHTTKMSTHPYNTIVGFRPSGNNLLNENLYFRSLGH